MKETKKMLEDFVDVPGISGSEDGIREKIKKDLKGEVDEIKEDKVGNIITKKGKGDFKVLLTAHMDEVGLVVSSIDEKGFLRFDTVGGLDCRILPSRQVKIHTDKKKVNGVIGSKVAHKTKEEERKKAFELNDLFIDVGAKDKKEVEKMGIKIGDFVELPEDWIELSSNKISGRCLDNRIGCAILTEVMKRVKPKNFTLYGVGTIQEEIGLKGARGPMFGINPDVIISIDVEISGDTPFLQDEHIPSSLGKGPIIGIRDSSYVIHKKMRKMFLDTAKKSKIPYQLGVTSGGTTETTLAVLTREGKPGGLIGVPVRYMHSSVEVADLGDIEKAIKLLEKSLDNVKKYFS